MKSEQEEGGGGERGRARWEEAIYICIIYCAVGKGELAEDVTRINPLS